MKTVEAIAFIVLCGVMLYLGSIGMRQESGDIAGFANEPVCAGGTRTCAGTRHANGHLYAYACECCEAAGCQPDSGLDLTPAKPTKGTPR